MKFLIWTIDMALNSTNRPKSLLDQPAPLDNQSPVQFWLERIKAAAKYRKYISDPNDWKRYWDLYCGRAYPAAPAETPADAARRHVDTKGIFSIIRSVKANIYPRRVRVLVDTDMPDFAPYIPVIEGILNGLFKGQKIKRAIGRCVLRSLICGTAVMKIGYDTIGQYTTERSIGEVGNTNRAEVDKDGERIEYDSRIQPGQPWVLAINTDDFLIPYGYTEIEEAPWVAHRITRFLEDIRSDERYDKSARDLVIGKRGRVSPSMEDESPWDYEDVDIYDPKEQATLYEIHDRKVDKLYVISEDSPEKFLLEADDAVGQNYGRHPFLSLVLNEDGENFWGLSLVGLIESLQYEENESRTQEVRKKRVEMVKFIYDKNQFSPEDLEKLTSAVVGGGVPCNGDPNNAVKVLYSYTPTDPTALELPRRDRREITGFNRNQMGEYDTSSRRTAREAGIVSQAAQIRIDEYRDAVADLIEDIARAYLSMIFAWWDQDEFVQVYRNGQMAYEKINPASLGLKVDYFTINVVPDDTPELGAGGRKQEFAALIQLLANIPPQMAAVNLMPVLSQGLRYIEGLRPEGIIGQPLPVQPPAAGGGGGQNA